MWDQILNFQNIIISDRRKKRIKKVGPRALTTFIFEAEVTSLSQGAQREKWKTTERSGETSGFNGD